MWPRRTPSWRTSSADAVSNVSTKYKIQRQCYNVSLSVAFNLDASLLVAIDVAGTSTMEARTVAFSGSDDCFVVRHSFVPVKNANHGVQEYSMLYAAQSLSWRHSLFSLRPQKLLTFACQSGGFCFGLGFWFCFCFGFFVCLLTGCFLFD